MLDRTPLYGLNLGMRRYIFHSSLALNILFTRNFFFDIHIVKFVTLFSSITIYTNGSQFCGGFRILERELQSYTSIINSAVPILEVLNGLDF